MSPDWAAKPEAVPYADLTNPQTLNQYAYVHNNPMSFGDPDGHCCDEWLGPVVDFTVGMLNAWGSDNLAGAGRMEQTNLSGKFGQAIGDLGATVQGVLETGVSGGGELVGVGLDGTGVLAPAGLAVNAVSTAGLVHGSLTTATAGTNFFKDIFGGKSGGVEPYNRNEQCGNTSSSQASKDARAAGEGQPCPNCGKTQKSGGSTRTTGGTLSHAEEALVHQGPQHELSRPTTVREEQTVP